MSEGVRSCKDDDLGCLVGEDVRRLTAMNTKLQDLCRTLQTQNKNVVQDAQEKATAEARQREELTQKMEMAMKDISSRLEEHSAESQKCMTENMELRSKLEHVSQFCDEMDHNHKEQVVEELALKFPWDVGSCRWREGRRRSVFCVRESRSSLN